MEFTHSGIRRYFQNTSWLLGGQIFRLGVSLVVTVAVARYLGPAQFGELNFVLAITLLLGVVANLGLTNRTKKELVEYPGNRNEILGTFCFLNLIPSILVYAIMFGMVITAEGNSQEIMLYCWLGGVFLISPFKGPELWFQSQVISHHAVKASTLGIALAAIFKLWLIVIGAGLSWFAAAIFLESLIVVAGQAVLYTHHAGSFREWRLNRLLAARLLKDSWPLLLSGVAVTVYMQVDRIMLGFLLGNDAVGQYSAAVRLSTIGYFVPMMLGTALFPAIVRAREKSRDLYWLRLRQFFELNALIAYLIIIPMFLGSPLLMKILFGEEFAYSSGVLSVHIWCSIFVFLGIARGQALLAEGHYLFVMVSAISGAILNLALNFTLIPLYGGIGAAISTLAAQMLASLGLCFFYKPTQRLGILLLAAAVFPFRFLWELKPGSS